MNFFLIIICNYGGVTSFTRATKKGVEIHRGEKYAQQDTASNSIDSLVRGIPL